MMLRGALRGIIALAAVNLTAFATRPLLAQAPVTLDDLRNLPGTPWLSVSPDGGTVAYLLSEPRGTSELWLAPFRGGSARRLTTGVAVRSVVGWNARGDALAYVAPDGDESALYTIRSGSEPLRTCRLPRGARSSVWLADGRSISFSARRADAPGEAIFLCDLASAAVRQVTPKGYFGLEFAWSPDGRRIALSRQESPGFYEGLESDIVLVDAASGAESPLVTRPGVDRTPIWSPDGTQIAFLSGFGRSGLLPNIGIAVVRPGEPPRDVGRGHDRGGFFEGPFLHGWSGDSRDIFYSVLDGLEAPLFRVAAAGGSHARVTLPVDPAATSYQYSVSSSGREIAFKISSISSPPDIFTARLGDASATRITQLHADWPRDRLPRAERIRWAAPDGDTIEGILVRPGGDAARASGALPLITILHGGPASAYNLSFPGLAFFDPYRDLLLATRGYAVLLPNPRGSGGYGERFRSAIRRNWGTGPAADVHAGIDYLIARGVADSTRLGLLGWSYGGYLGAWMLAHSDRFAVASIGAGVYDLTSHYGQAAPQMEEYMGGSPWRIPSLYREQSPVQHVERMRTPTLIFHGETDNAVSIAQSELLVAAMRREGAPVEFVRYPGEGHSLRQPRTQDDSFARLLAWVEQWINTPRRADRAGAHGGFDSERGDNPSPAELLSRVP